MGEKIPDSPVQSPCIDVCKLDDDKNLCIGCFRTVNEIRAWKDSSEEERMAIVMAAKKRSESEK